MRFGTVMFVGLTASALAHGCAQSDSESQPNDTVDAGGGAGGAAGSGAGGDTGGAGGHVGSAAWAIALGGPGDDQGLAVSTDAAGNSYVVGHFAGQIALGPDTLTSAGGLDAFVAKVSAQGNVVWARSAGGTADDDALNVAVDAAGNSTVAGGFQETVQFGATPLDSAGGYDVFVARYSPDGELTWVVSAGGVADDAALGVGATPEGGAVITGYFDTSADFDTTTLDAVGENDLFVARYSAAGVLEWAKSAGGVGWDGGFGIAADGDGNALVTGYFMDTATFGSVPLDGQGVDDAFVAKYSPTGEVLWAASGGGTEQDEGLGVAVDAAANVWVTGFYQGVALFGSTELPAGSGDSTFVARYAPDGTLLWVVPITATSAVGAFSIATTSTGEAVAAGFFAGALTVGDDMAEAQGLTDVFAVRIGNDGALASLIAAGGSFGDQGYSVAMLPGGDSVVAGIFGENATFGATPLTASGELDAFLWRVPVP